MYLARGILNPASRDVQRDLADAGHLHRTLMKAFPDGVGDQPRKALAVLHRVDSDRGRGAVVLFVQSADKPNFSAFPADYFASVADDLDLALAGEPKNPRVRAVTRERDAIAVGDRFVFRLRANTTRKILTKSLPDGTKQNGKRVPVRGDEARLDWLTRRAKRGGFHVETVRVSEVRAVGRTKNHRLSFAGATFEGTLSVSDAELFRTALAAGVGPAKAFGFGLLSIQRVAR